MNITLTSILLAAGAGVIGTLTGGMEAFIIYGFILIFQTAMTSCGIELPFFSQYVSGLFFMPCVMFSATVPATGLAAMRKHDINAWEIGRSLAFTNDPLILLIGAVTGVAGYLIFMGAEYLHLPLDTGSFSVVAVALIARLAFKHKKHFNKAAVYVFRSGKRWVFQMIIAAVVSAVTAYFYQQTGILTIGFMMSAALLLLQLFQRTQFFPTTHHITMVSALAMAATGNIFIAMGFGMLAEIIFTLFAGFFNMGCGTHIDPPAVTILFCSFIIAVFF